MPVVAVVADSLRFHSVRRSVRCLAVRAQWLALALLIGGAAPTPADAQFPDWDAAGLPGHPRPDACTILHSRLETTDLPPWDAGPFVVQPSTAGEPLRVDSGGGWRILIDRHTITLTDPLGRNTVQMWGDPHENLNGKHLKDWWGERRSVILGDGTKVTMEAAGPHGVVVLTSIYALDGNLQFDNVSNTVLHQSQNSVDTRLRESTQYDGETACFNTHPGSERALFENVYEEWSDFERAPGREVLGSTGGATNPNQVNDYVDDPRLAHT